MADADPIDFGKKKKKKDKKDKKDVDTKKKDKNANLTIVEFTPGTLYTYEVLLERLHDTKEAQDPKLKGIQTKKTTIKPPDVIRVGSKKMAWTNFRATCDTLCRQPEHFMQFLSTEFGAEVNLAGEGQQLVMRGKFMQKQCEAITKRYVKEFVVCGMCKSMETKLSKDSSTRLWLVQCSQCGASRNCTGIKSGYHATSRADRKKAKFAAGAQVHG